MLNLIVRDEFASRAEVAAALAAWPEDGWYEYEGSRKRVSVPGAQLPEPITALLHRLATMPEAFGWIPDLGLWGAGLHEMPPGPGLGWHADAERHPSLGFGRVRSGVLYLCGDGDLEFREGMTVRPAPGRLIMFDGLAMHRVGTVTELRRSVSLFWYDGPVGGGRTRAEFEGEACH